MAGPVYEAGVVWVLLDPGDAAREAVLETLAASQDLVPESRAWPVRKERGKPAAVVVRTPVRERLMALKHRLGDAKAIVLAADDADRDEIRAVIAQDRKSVV